MKTVAEVIGVSRSNLIERMRERPKKRIGRPPPPDENLVSEIKAVIVELPTYGYRRVHAILKRQALAAGSTVSMSNPTDRVEIITSVQRRRRWTAAEKVRMVEETFEPGMTVSLVARRHGVAPNQLFTWRRLVVEGALTAAGSGEQVVPASDYRALQSQVRELQRLLGKKTLEAEILKEALEHATGSKKQLRLPPSPPKDGSR
jgi:transposase